jgi:RNA recognition motif-containing protein
MEAESTTLFVADIPFDLQEPDFINLFSPCEGFIDARIRRDKNDKPVGFVDFDTVPHASAARERFQGHKFSEYDTGLNIHFSRATGGARQGGSGPKRNRDEDPARPAADDNRAPTKRPLLDSHDREGIHGAGSRERHAGGHAGSSQHSHLQSLFPPSAATAAAYYSMQPAFSQAPFAAAYQNMAASMYPPQLPPEASNTLYVEGVPSDATERELSHIFRPYAGFSSLRLLQKESKQYPNRTYLLCFVEFDNKLQASLAMQALQGYRMDKNDTKGLHISYAKTDRKERRRADQAAGPGRPPTEERDPAM